MSCYFSPIASAILSGTHRNLPCLTICRPLPCQESVWKKRRRFIRTSLGLPVIPVGNLSLQRSFRALL
jgi:hypothetical protein